jgi:glycosyltransferase involved in cell wall biosynthesis
MGLRGMDYVAFLGNLEPRKNVPALVRAWAKACDGRDNAPALVLAGGAGWDDEVDNAIHEVPAGLRVLRPGYLPFSTSRRSSAARSSSPTRATARASACRSSRRWRAAHRC